MINAQFTNIFQLLGILLTAFLIITYTEDEKTISQGARQWWCNPILNSDWRETKTRSTKTALQWERCTVHTMSNVFEYLTSSKFIEFFYYKSCCFFQVCNLRFCSKVFSLFRIQVGWRFHTWYVLALTPLLCNA